MTIGQLHRVQAGDTCQRCRQLIPFRHGRSTHECRDDADVTSEARLDLEPDVVIGVVESATSLGISCGEPGFADQGDQDVAATDCAVDRIGEVAPGLVRVEVPEDLLRLAPARSQRVVQKARIRPAVVASVVDEDPEG
jgi:hypothetical protein